MSPLSCYNVILALLHCQSESSSSHHHKSFHSQFSPYVTNRLVQHYHLGVSTFEYRGIRCAFRFLVHFVMKFLYAIYANRIALDGILSSATSHLELNCLSCPTNRTSNLYQIRATSVLHPRSNTCKHVLVLQLLQEAKILLMRCLIHVYGY